ncbi:periplasmic binding protein-like I [Polychytrium aggregatum]|uniref:periplasmic binding protein-like I n=1 Tax=Polychytrium aggregatum TaxID=110093 RepID=UPI0022FE899D|nr:periplasmic binding protein-like I [Polychytrium aggregatum]KAI9202700.1 periplasmic binding protein-like I [Polychytrium aggregatum]
MRLHNGTLYGALCFALLCTLVRCKNVTNSTQVLKIGSMAFFSLIGVNAPPQYAYYVWYTSLEAQLMQAGMQAAINVINTRDDILPGIRLVGYTANTYGSLGNTAQGLMAARALVNSGANLLIGDSIVAGDSVKMEALWAGVQNVPMCSPIISDSSTYPTFYRTIPQAELKGRAMAVWLYNMGLRRIAVMVAVRYLVVRASVCHDPVSDPVGPTFLPGFLDQAGILGLNVYPQVTIASQGATTSDYTAQLKTVKNSNVRVIVCMCSILPATVSYLYGKKYGLDAPQYTWLTHEGLMNSDVNTLLESVNFYTNFNTTLVPQAGGPINGTYVRDYGINMNFYAYGPETVDPTRPSFIEYNNSVSALGFPEVNLLPVAVLTYDCVMTAAKAFDRLLKSGVSFSIIANNTLTSSQLSTESFLNLTFSGASGVLDYDSFGNRVTGTFSVHSETLNMGNITDTVEAYVTVDNFMPESCEIYFMNTTTFGTSVTNTSSPLLKLPTDYPPYNYLNVQWGSSGATALTTIAVIIIVACASLFIYAVFLTVTSSETMKYFNLLYLFFANAYIILCMICVITEIGVPTRRNCIVEYYFWVNLMMSFVHGCLLSRTIRYLQTSKSHTLKETKLPTLLPVFICSATFIMDVLISVGREMTGSMVPYALHIYQTEFDIYVTCAGTDPTTEMMVSLLYLVFNLAWLILASVLAFQTRNAKCYAYDTKFVLVSAVNLTVVYLLLSIFMMMLPGISLFFVYYFLMAIAAMPLLIPFVMVSLLRVDPSIGVKAADSKAGVMSTTTALKTGTRGNGSARKYKDELLRPVACLPSVTLYKQTISGGRTEVLVNCHLYVVDNNTLVFTHTSPPDARSSSADIRLKNSQVFDVSRSSVTADLQVTSISTESTRKLHKTRKGYAMWSLGTGAQRYLFELHEDTAESLKDLIKF